MKFFKSLIFGLFLLAAPVFAQNPVQNISTGSITTTDTSCTLANSTACVVLPLPNNNRSFSVITVSGTWTGTLNFIGTNAGLPFSSSLSVAPQAGGAAVTTATANGTWTVPVPALTVVGVYASSMSGTALVTITSSTAAGGGSSSFNAAVPGPIGGTTPSSGAFTTVSASGQITSTLATGAAPLSISSTTPVPNLTLSSNGQVPAINLAGTSNGGITGQLPIGNVGSSGLSGTPPATISATGAIGCATCVVASSPGVGLAHFAGSTQTVTSTAVALGGADVSGTLPNTHYPTGIFNFIQTAQSQVVVSTTEYYITSSDLDMPAAYTTAIGAGTTMRWRIALTKTNAGTGTFQILLKKGTNGSTADTSIVTQTIGTQTAVVDNMEADIELTWASATAAYWTIVPHQAAASGTGFGLVYPATAAQFTGTISGQTTTTASDKYGLSVKFTTGTPTFVVNMVQAQAFGVN